MKEFGQWQNNWWTWRLEWNRELNNSEQQEAALLADVLRPLQPVTGVVDEWVWPCGYWINQHVIQ